MQQESILKAIEEFDELGREVFLEKYGYAHECRCFLVHEGRRYDCAAIVGAAYRFERPGQGALSREEFSAGEPAVKHKLEALGFTVEVHQSDDATGPQQRYRVPAQPTAGAQKVAGQGVHSGFDDREAFAGAASAMAVIRRHSNRFRDEEAVWESFIDWHGRGEGEYLRRLRAGRKFIFYSLLQDLYDFAEEVCGQNVTRQIGEHLAGWMLARHMPDILEATLVRSGSLPDLIPWLVHQLVTEATSEIYTLATEGCSEEGPLRISFRYNLEDEMIEYLKRSGHNPERAFANSFGVFGGAVRTLVRRTIYGFRDQQLESRLRTLHGEFLFKLTDKNRFHYENIIEILTDYVRELRERKQVEAAPPVEEAYLHVSEAMKTAWERMRKAAASDETVLVCGESGTGKSYYASVIHRLSARCSGPFVEVGMTSEVGSDNLIQSNLFGHVQGAFTGAGGDKQGLFALADGGTIFLDEIGDASAELQAKLLRVMERKTFKRLGGLRDISVDVRIIAATNRDLAQLVEQGAFREDLYYRLNILSIVLPPLRERKEDLEPLVRKLFERVRHESKREDKYLSDEVLEALRGCEWPGNIRQLENALRHAVVFSEGARITPRDLPQEVRETALKKGLGEPATSVINHEALMRAISSEPQPAEDSSFESPAHVDYARREYLRALIRHYSGNLTKIARHWNRSSENTLRKLIRGFGLQDELQAARE